VYAGFILRVYKCLILGHNKEIKTTGIENPMINLFGLMVFDSFLIRRLEAIKIITIGKKNEIGKTILSGNLKKMVIPITNTQLNNSDNSDQNKNCNAEYLFLSKRKNKTKNKTIKRDE
jgi:hypothetical protein